MQQLLEPDGGVIIVTGSYRQSMPIRNAADAAAVNSIDARVRDIAASIGASDVQYPVLIDRTVLERAEYPKAFPHLLMCACCTRHPDDGDASDPAIQHHAETAWCLSPAVCYHTYAQLAGDVLDGLTVLTARGRCFRHERETAAGIRQVEFEMREIVFLGSRECVEVSVGRATQMLEAVALEVGVSGEWRVAEDPFFLPSAAGKALMQRLMKTKVEYQSLDASRLAFASVNRHASFFGRRFDITMSSGEPVETACVAVGLDRWWRHAHLAEERRSEHARAHAACVTR